MSLGHRFLCRRNVTNDLSPCIAHPVLWWVRQHAFSDAPLNHGMEKRFLVDAFRQKKIFERHQHGTWQQQVPPRRHEQRISMLTRGCACRRVRQTAMTQQFSHCPRCILCGPFQLRYEVKMRLAYDCKPIRQRTITCRRIVSNSWFPCL